MSMRYQAGIVLPGYNALKVANAPTIGTATAGTSNCASVTFTAPACVGGGAISSYTVFSNCGAFRNSGASSPIVVSGLTTSSSYTFKAIATNAYGPSYPTSASNSITAATVTCATYTTSGSYSWVAPTGVTSVAVLAVGGGGGGGVGYVNCCGANGRAGGGGAGLGYKNNYTVTPGVSYDVVVGIAGPAGTSGNGGNGGCSYFVSTAVVKGGRGIGGTTSVCIPPTNGTFTGDGGGTGGGGGVAGNNGTNKTGAGGGAGGYSGAGGYGGSGGSGGNNGTAASGGGGGGGAKALCGQGLFGAGGGGVGIFGQGSNGVAGTTCSASTTGGGGGSGGADGSDSNTVPNGGAYGGGGGARPYGYCNPVGSGGVGAVRIVWAGGSRGTPSFPSTNVGA